MGGSRFFLDIPAPVGFIVDSAWHVCYVLATKRGPGSCFFKLTMLIASKFH
jgi:hypothetical protein